MAPHGKELSEDLIKRIVSLHKDGLGNKKITKTLKLSCSTVAKTIQRFNRTGSTQNWPHHGRPKKMCAHAQRHFQKLCLGNRRMSAARIAADVEGVGCQPVSAQTIRHTLHIGLHGYHPRRKPLLKMMHKKAHKQFAEDKQTKDMDYWNHVRIWRKEHETMDPSCLVSTVQASGGSVMVWGIFSWYTLGPLVPIEHCLNATAYLSIVADHVRPFITTVYPSSDVTSSSIMHHVTKLKSSQTGFLNMTMSSLYSNGPHSHQISIQ